MDNEILLANENKTSTGTSPDKDKLLRYILDKLDKLAEYPVYVDNAIKQIGAMAINECPNGGTGDAARASAIGNSVAAREETNRALIEFLKQIYSDVKPVNPQIYKPTPQDSQKEAVYQSISQLIDRIDTDGDNASELLELALGALKNR